MLLSSCMTYDNFEKTFISKDDKVEKTVKIGVFEPMSGEDKDFGELEIQGIKIAHKMFPEVLGRKVELIYGDNQSDMEVAKTVATDLVNQEVCVVLGSYGSVNSLIGEKIFAEAKVPAIAITNTNPLVTSYNPYYFRVRALDSFQGIALAKYANEKLGLTRAAIMKPSGDDYAMNLSETFSNKFMMMTEDPNAIVSSIDYNPEQEDYDDEFERMYKAEAEVVFLPVELEEASRIIRQANDKGYEFLFLGTDMWENGDFVDKAGIVGSKRTGYSTIFDAETDTTSMSDNFIKAYREEYGDKEPESAVALGFDAYMIAVNSISKAGTDKNGSLIREKISETVKFPGASGTITFNMNGDPFKTVIIKRIENGKPKADYTMEPAIK